MSDYRPASPGHWDKESWSLVLGHVAGIRVRVHASFLILAVFHFMVSTFINGVNGLLYFSIPQFAMVFLFVLLHEFGHCFACRAVSGEADDILMWPLGGLATCRPPHRPAEHLVTAAAGPAVNLVLMLCLLPFIIVMNLFGATLFNPFNFYPEIRELMQTPPPVATYVWMAFKLNYILFLFNVFLPVFPLDGGQILRCILWFRTTYYQATTMALRIGIVGGGLMILVGIYCAGAWGYQNFIVAVIGLFAVLQCLMTQREIEIERDLENEFGYDFSQGYTSLEASTPKQPAPKRGPGLFAFRTRFRSWREKRQEKHRTFLESELDRILEKISRTGMESLTRTEKKTLTEASKLRRDSSSGSRPKK